MLSPLPPPLTCKRCNFLIHTEWIYCEQCGYQLQPAPPPPLQSIDPSKQLKVRNLQLLKTANLNLNPKQGKRKKNKDKEIKRVKTTVEKLKELEEKRYQEATTVVEKLEKQNHQMVRFYQKIMTKADKKLPPLCDSNSSYLDEQPSILDRLADGFTVEEDAERVLFWGRQEPAEKAQPMEKKFFTGSFWGQTESGIEEKESSATDVDPQDGEPATVIQWNPVTEIIPETSHSSPEGADDARESGPSDGLESTRRDITRILRKVIQLMRWILRQTDFDLVVDPIALPHSLRQFSQYSVRLTAVITRAYDIQLMANDLSHQYLVAADRLRQQIAFQIAEAQHEADLAHHKSQELYECASAGVFLNADCLPDLNHTTISDPILIQRNQQRVLEYSQTLLDPVRRHVNDLIAKETQIIMRIKYDFSIPSLVVIH
jgi:hypothetical protein